MQETGSSSMSRLAVIALVIAAIVALAYMLALVPGAPYGTSTGSEKQAPANTMPAAEVLPEEQDLRSTRLDGLNQGLTDIEAELAK